MHVVIFEGMRWGLMAPLVMSRPVFMLRSGISSLLHKQIRCVQPKRLTLWVREELAEMTRRTIVPTLPVPTKVNEPLDDEPALLINGRTLFFGKFEYPHETGIASDDEMFLRYAYVKSPGMGPADMLDRTPRVEKLLELPQMMPQGRMALYPWDLIAWNEESLVEDSIHLECCNRTKPAGPYHLVNDKNVCLAEEVILQPGVVLDGTRGPVIVEKGALIGANSVLQGPCHIGPGSEVAPLSLIRSGVSIGPMCKVGGELINTIIQGYSNKAHAGYLGDSFVGEWVNLGAGTTTSNLKNTLGTITMRIGSKIIPTDRKKLGAIIGDHVKTGINTRLNTGTYVGYCSMLATCEAIPHFVPSFSFWTDGKKEQYRLGKAKEMMSGFYAMKGKKWTKGDEAVLNYVSGMATKLEE